MQDALHQGGHKYLKLLFVLALAGSSALFFIGPAIPKPPALVVVIVGGVLGLALEWSYYTFSCDLSEAISEGNKVGIFVNGLYTLAGGAASWFLFVNAALHVGWAPTDDLLGLSRQQWAMIMAALIVVVIFVLSARRKRATNAVDLQAWGRSVTIMLPNADDATRLSLLATIAKAASESQGPKALTSGRIVEAKVNRPGLVKRGWQALWSGEEVQEGASAAREEQPERDEQDGALRRRDAEASPSPEGPSSAGRGAARLAEQRPARARQESLADLSAFAQAVKADTGVDLEALVLQLFANAAKEPQAASEQIDTVPLAAPVEEMGSQPVEDYPPLPAARGAVPGTNHGNHGDTNGTFEQWNVGGEGEGTDGNTSFRRPTN